jgi:ATP/maltotriose-dependent transcriptional regulator MalT
VLRDLEAERTIIQLDLPAYPRNKISPPRFARPIAARDRLFARLNAIIGVALVEAPAGSGKTALLASWIDARRASHEYQEAPYIWYALDQADRDPVRLVDGIAAAIECAVPGAGESARQTLAGGCNYHEVLATLLAGLEQLDAATMIIDDVHHIGGAPGAEGVLDYVVRFRPDALRVVFASRPQPASTTQLAFANDGVQIISQQDLRFSDVEARSLLQVRGLTDEDAHSVIQRVGGWAMGLVLLARIRNGATSLTEPTDLLQHYLLEHVMNGLPAAAREFALESALLRSFSARTTDAILGRRDGEMQLRRLIEDGLLVETFGGEGDTIVRYHDLFADVLSETLRRTALERYEAIHLSAATYYGDDPHTALAHCAKVSDPSVLAIELVRVLPLLLRLGYWEALIQYGTMIPARHRPALLLRMLSYSYYVRGDDAAAIETANAAYELAIALHDYESKYSALVLRANSMLRQDRSAEILEYCLPALAEAHVTGPAVAEGWLAAIAAKCLFREGRLSEARPLVEHGRALYSRQADASGLSGVAWLDQDLAPLLLEIGELQEAEALLTSAIQVATDHDTRSLATYCKSTRTEALLLRGETAAALTLAQSMSDVAHREGNMIARYTALCVQARALAQLGRVQEAIAVLACHAGVVANFPAPVRVVGELIRASVAITGGDFEQARQALDDAAALGVTPRAKGMLALEAGALALAEGRHDDADSALTQACASFERYALRPRHATALILHAHALVCLGKDARAMTCLTLAGKIAHNAAWVPGVVCDIAPARPSLQALASHWRLQGKSKALVTELLRLGDRRTQSRSTQEPGTAKSNAAKRRSLDAATPFRFSPFGGGEIARNGTRTPLARLRGEKARELLAFAVSHGRPLRREEILEAIWDGACDERVLGAFRTAGYQLRRYLGDGTWRLALDQPTAALEAAEQGLAIDPACESLRHAQMRILIGQGRQAQAMESYRRHLLVLKEEDLGAPSEKLQALVRSIRG